VLTAAFILSAVSGVARGVQWLSNINMVLAALLAVFLVVVGPTVLILNLLPTSIGAYVDQWATMVGRSEAVGGPPMLAWLSSWTVFYWAWWISWAPFVGMFLARISRGRTIRQFLCGVILAPSVVSLVWFAIFGGTAIAQRQSGRTFSADADSQLFEVLQAYPLSTVTGVLVLILVGLFFVSGADAASIVMGTLSQRGSDTPRRWVVAFWGAVMGAVAVVMLLAGGNDALTGLQSLTILVAAPFTVVMVMLCVALVRDLQDDRQLPHDTRTGLDGPDHEHSPAIEQRGRAVGDPPSSRDRAESVDVAPVLETNTSTWRPDRERRGRGSWRSEQRRKRDRDTA
jgi:choline-glycine betaine transporter